MSGPVDTGGDTAPPIPASLRKLPVMGGLVVPFNAGVDSHRRPALGAIDGAKNRLCLEYGLCSVDGRRLGRPSVLLVRERDLERKISAEPALHPECAGYTMEACPMIAGRMARCRGTLRKLAEGRIDVDDSLTVAWKYLNAPDAEARLGQPAEPWFAVWLNRYQLILDPLTGNPAASFEDVEVRRVRPVTP